MSDYSLAYVQKRQVGQIKHQDAGKLVLGNGIGEKALTGGGGR